MVCYEIILELIVEWYFTAALSRYKKVSFDITSVVPALHVEVDVAISRN